jgi:hypothetical protein
MNYPEDCYFVRNQWCGRHTQEDAEDSARRILALNPALTREEVAKRIVLDPEARCPSCGCLCAWRTIDCNEAPGDKCSGQVRERKVLTTHDERTGKEHAFPVHACDLHWAMSEAGLVPAEDPMQRFVTKHLEGTRELRVSIGLVVEGEQ